jgi:gas vesicle protein/uncharacterized protein YciW
MCRSMSSFADPLNICVGIEMFAALKAAILILEMIAYRRELCHNFILPGSAYGMYSAEGIIDVAYRRQYHMTQQSQDIQLDRTEMFALGAAAGAIITAAISEYLERQRPKTPWEKAQAKGVEALSSLSGSAKAGSQRAKEYVGAASDYVQEVIETTPKSWQKSKQRSKKQSKRARQQTIGLKEAAAAALGVSAATGVVDKVRDYASSAAERVVGDPYAVSGSIKETLKERFSSNGSSSNGHLTDKIQDASGSALETLKTVAATAADTVKDYASTARESLKEVELGDRARIVSTTAADTLKDYASTARESLKEAELGDKVRKVSATAADTIKDYAANARESLRDVKLGDKARDYSTTVVESVKDYASTARESLKEAELGDKLKDYAVIAGATMAAYSNEASKATRRAVKQSASKVSESASHLADATSQQATQIRKGASKSVTRTRRRVRWGLRAFIIGLAIGLLTAPQSGQRTRDAVTSFIENLLDVLMPEQQRSASF